jgi:hypothetical protein
VNTSVRQAQYQGGLIATPPAGTANPQKVTVQQVLNVQGRFLRILASDVLGPLNAATNGYQGSLTEIPRCGRFPARFFIDGAVVFFEGSDWKEIGIGAHQIAFISNDEGDGIAAAATANTAWKIDSDEFVRPSYQYLIETSDEPPTELGQVDLPFKPIETPGFACVEIDLTHTSYSLLDYNLSRNCKRRTVTIQNQGPHPILVVPWTDADVGARIVDPTQGPNPVNPITIANGATFGPIEQAWGVSFWGQATTADQSAGAGTICMELA